jgi:hypothetical protein
MADSNNSSTQRPPRTLRRFVALGGLLGVLVWRSLLRPAAQPIAAGAAESQPENPDVAFEASDWSVGPVALVYGGTLVLLAISIFALMAAYRGSLKDVDRTLRIAPPGPGLQTDPRDDMKRLREEEERWLNTYRWIDKQRDVVHIPIGEAMKKLARTGAPGFPEGQQ